jgi:hypothetical protein
VIFLGGTLTRIFTNFSTTEPMIGSRQPKLGLPKIPDKKSEGRIARNPKRTGRHPKRVRGRHFPERRALPGSNVTRHPTGFSTIRLGLPGLGTIHWGLGGRRDMNFRNHREFPDSRENDLNAVGVAY